MGSARSEQNPGPTTDQRERLAEVVMLPVLREQLKLINDWLEDDQIEEVIKHLIASFPGISLTVATLSPYCKKTPALHKTARSGGIA